jgi:DNA polymerase-3 subunit beta
MRFTLTTKQAKKLFTLFNRVADARSTMPVLGAVCMTVQPQNRIGFRVTDLESDLRITLKAQAPCEEGMAIVSCANIIKLLRKSKSKTSIFEAHKPADGSVIPKMKLRTSGVNFTLDAFVPDDYPNWSTDGISSCGYVNYYGLQRAVSQVEHAVSYDDARPHLSGMLFEMTEDEELMCVGTDGHRLALATTDIEGPAHNTELNGTALASRYSINHLLHVFKAFPDAEECTVGYADKWLHVDIVLAEDNEVERIYMKLKLNDATFPPIERVISKDAPKWSLVVKREALLQAADTLSVVSDVLRMRGTEKVLSLMADGDEMSGEKAVEGRHIRVRGNGPKAIKAKDIGPVGVANRYVMDVLKSWDDETEVRISMFGETEQIQLRGMTTHPLAVVMPMRL